MRLGLAVALTTLLAEVVAAQEISFAPREPRAPSTHVQGDPDWNRFFEPDAPWQKAASRIDTIELQWGYIGDASDSELTATAAGLRRLGIAITVSMQSVAAEPTLPCGKTEGYDDPAYAAFLAEKLKRLGIAPKYLVLDGPLWFGHYATGPQECRFSIEETAERTSRILRLFLDRFPDAVIRDIEGTPLSLQSDWEAGYLAFKSAVEAAVARRVEALILDVNWSYPDWPDSVVAMAKLARSLRMQFGIIYNGDNRDESNAAWLAHAERNFTVLESQYRLIPDIALFSSWNKYPTHALPETSPETFTALINRYLLPRPRFEARRNGAHWRVQLADAAGRPLAGERVTIARLGHDPARTPPLRTASGRVPEEATSAILGWRVNIECFCAGNNDLVVGDLDYREDEGGAASETLQLAQAAGRPREDGVEISTLPGAGGPLYRLRVGREQTFLLNSPAFAVTPGARYRLRVPLGAIDEAGLYGNATIIWLDRNGKGIARTNLGDPGERSLVATVTTDGGGYFTVPNSRQTQEVSFVGTPTLRPALARLEPSPAAGKALK